MLAFGFSYLIIPALAEFKGTSAFLYTIFTPGTAKLNTNLEKILEIFFAGQLTCQLCV
jgi:hypothetical protein